MIPRHAAHRNPARRLPVMLVALVTQDRPATFLVIVRSVRRVRYRCAHRSHNHVQPHAPPGSLCSRPLLLCLSVSLYISRSRTRARGMRVRMCVTLSRSLRDRHRYTVTHHGSHDSLSLSLSLSLSRALFFLLLFFFPSASRARAPRSRHFYTISFILNLYYAFNYIYIK